MLHHGSPMSQHVARPIVRSPGSATNTTNMTSPYRPNLPMTKTTTSPSSSSTIPKASTTTSTTSTGKKRRRIGSLPASDVTPYAAYEHLMPKKLMDWEPAAMTLHHLMEFEKRLDAFLSRKICDYRELTSQPMKLTRTLRLYLYHYAVNGGSVSSSTMTTTEMKSEPMEGVTTTDLPTFPSSSSSFHFSDGSSTSTPPLLSSSASYSLPPSFTFYIEGRWLSDSKITDPSIPLPSKKLSEVLRSLRIELRRDGNLSTANHNTHEFIEPEMATSQTDWVEWVKGDDRTTNVKASRQGEASSRNRVDGFEVKRRCSSSQEIIDVKVLLQLDLNPDRFRLSPALASLLGISVETKTGTAVALWNYLKENQLQTLNDDDVINSGSTTGLSHDSSTPMTGDGSKRKEKVFICDDSLRKVFGVDRWTLSQLPSLLDSHLLPLEPIELDYKISMKDLSTPDQPQMVIYDMDVEVDDPLHDRMQNFIMSLSSSESSSSSPEVKQSSKDTIEWDVRFVELLYEIRQSCVKREFMKSFASQPCEFINQWVASQAHDLKTVLGEGDAVSDLTLHMEDWRANSRIFHEDWIQEATAYYLQAKSHQTLQEWMSAQHQQQQSVPSQQRPFS